MNTAKQRFPLRYSFEQINEGQFKEVLHYQQTNFDIESSVIPYYANISKNREFNNSKGVEFWYKSKEKEGKKWSKVITGLKRTKHSTVYFGDIPKVVNGNYQRQHFLMFVFSEDFKKLAILIFVNFYPNNENTFINNYINNFK